MRLELPEVKRKKMVAVIDDFSHRKFCTIREFAHLIGKLVDCCRAIEYGWLYNKRFEREKFLALLVSGGDYDAQLELSADLQIEFDWWKQNITTSFGPIRSFRFIKEIYSDASKTGWGAYCCNEGTHGFWSDTERGLHINQLELIAVFMALKCFASELYDCEILLRIDNTTAIAYVNRMGGVQYAALHGIAKEIWQWCECRKIWIFASYIASKENVEADRESRIKNIDTEWELSSWAYEKVISEFGKPKLDLFASRINAKCQAYCSWHRDPDALAIDAFTINWKSKYFYAFPPFALVLRFLRKVIADRACGIAIVPNWPSQPWFPIFMDLLVSPASITEITGFDCREIVGESYRRKKFSDSVIETLLASLAESTWKQYSGPIKLWANFCRETETDIYKASANRILEFLQMRYGSGASYGTLNATRSAISLVSTNDMTNDWIISRFFKGIFRLRPTKPRYDETWDVGIVLTYIANLYPLESLNNQQLSERLVTLLALGTAHRVQTFSLMRLDNISHSAQGFEIRISDIIKTSRPGAFQPLLLLPYFREQPRLCIASTLKRYLEITKPLRGDCSNVLITSRKPFKSASTQTISRWIRSVLAKSGIGPEFTAHSTRHASTSAALAKGLDISAIRNTAGWSKDSQVFAEYYNRPIKSGRKDFAATVFS
ncbi:uncharacterized protein [Neodiprion pinetum]|uniref:uncharacterized protein n=1 Tax=Neodiprion pinetum TaxID=441929 RepID=UPI001EE0E2AC|nr:uncharacterized protein LOC124212277 [Neodiprion pinetum]